MRRSLFLVASLCLSAHQVMAAELWLCSPSGPSVVGEFSASTYEGGTVLNFAHDITVTDAASERSGVVALTGGIKVTDHSSYLMALRGVSEVTWIGDVNEPTEPIAINLLSGFASEDGTFPLYLRLSYKDHEGNDVIFWRETFTCSNR